MSWKFLLIPIAMAICITTIAVGSRYRLVQVQSGTIVQCLDPNHIGETVVQSSIKTLRVHSKDSKKYSVEVDSLVCEKCQDRARVEEQAASARKQKEDAFVSALRKHDDSVLLCCRRIAGTTQANPYSLSLRSVRRDIDQLRTLALSGKQLCAPERLAQVEFQYGKSMDELLASLPYIEKGIRDNDMDAMRLMALHMLRSKQFRDAALEGIDGR